MLKHIKSLYARVTRSKREMLNILPEDGEEVFVYVPRSQTAEAMMVKYPRQVRCLDGKIRNALPGDIVVSTRSLVVGHPRMMVLTKSEFDSTFVRYDTERSDATSAVIEAALEYVHNAKMNLRNVSPDAYRMQLAVARLEMFGDKKEERP